MKKNQMRSVLRIAVIAVLLMTAFWIRIYNKTIPLSELSLILSYIRVLIELGLLSAFGISLRSKIIRNQTRRYLSAIIGLMVLWIFFRSVKNHLVYDAVICRYIWYLFYLPILFLPVYFLFVALSLGKPENYRVPVWSKVISCISGLLLIMVLSNDLHQQVFFFTGNDGLFREDAYRHQWGFYLVCAWILLLTVCTFVLIIIKSRVPKSRRNSMLPLLLIVCLIVYLVTFGFGHESLVFWLGDFTVVTCFFLVGIIDSFIYCGLIPSNAYYAEIFSQAGYSSAQILDRDYRVHYSSQNAEPIDRSLLKQAQNKAILVSEGKLLHTMPLIGGSAVWIEDVTAITRLQRKLGEVRESLSEANAVLKHRYEQEKEIRSIEEQNRLYDLLQKESQRQIDRIGILVKDYQTQKESERRKTLAQIAVLCSFVKRRKHLTLSVCSSIAVAESELSLAIGECLETLRLLGVRSNKMIETGREYLDGKQITRAYDFFEDVIETTLPSLKTVLVSVCRIDGVLRIGMNVRTDENPESLIERCPSAIIFCEDQDEWSLVLPLDDETRRKNS